MVLGTQEDQDQGVEPGTVFQDLFLGGEVTHEILQLGDSETVNFWCTWDFKLVLL